MASSQHWGGRSRFRIKRWEVQGLAGLTQDQCIGGPGSVWSQGPCSFSTIISASLQATVTLYANTQVPFALFPMISCPSSLPPNFVHLFTQSSLNFFFSSQCSINWPPCDSLIHHHHLSTYCITGSTEDTSGIILASEQRHRLVGRDR